MIGWSGTLPCAHIADEANSPLRILDYILRLNLSDNERRSWP